MDMTGDIQDMQELVDFQDKQSLVDTALDTVLPLGTVQLLGTDQAGSPDIDQNTLPLEENTVIHNINLFLETLTGLV